MSKRAKDDFAVMRLFLEVLPSLDLNAIEALLGWLEMRGTEEMEKRRREAPPVAPQ